jgi:hypothetical protein
VDDEEWELEGEDVYSTMFHIKSKDPITVEMQVHGQELTMELDTGASTTVIGENVFRKLSKTGKLELCRSTKKLRTYTGDVIPVVGQCEVVVRYNDVSKLLSAIVVKGDGPCLLGRDWLAHFKLNWSQIFQVRSAPTRQSGPVPELDKILETHTKVFEESLGTIEGTKARIHVDPSSKPLYFKARPVPHALREKIEVELDRLVKEGTLEPVEFSEWAAPIVPIVKQDKSIRICGDYKVTVNKVSKLDNYPIPKTEDLYATLGGGKEFTKLDLSQAYQQLVLDEESKKYTTINTHKGLFRYNRLPFGIASAPGIFQRVMENILQGIPNVIVRIDDILVTGPTRGRHLENLENVFTRLENVGAHLKRSKCTFLAPEVIYLGNNVNKDGIQPVPEKIRAIQDAPRPTNLKELQAYLGMLNYYSCYLSNISTILAPLHMLLRKDTPWNWSKDQQSAFEKSKEMLQSSDLLVHYDPEKELILACDASPYGVGAVLSHIMEDGREKPIAYASRTLAPAEKNYSQLDKEGLAVIFGVKKFHQYIYGHSVKIYTDHKPLLGLFASDKAVPPMAAGRIQRWALILSAYEYELLYRKGDAHGNADGLSRLPLSDTVQDTPILGETVLLLEQLDEMPVTAKEIKQWTASDPVLSRVYTYIQNGWPEKCQSEELRPYFSRKCELDTHDGLVLWGGRIVVPRRGRDTLLDELHVGHPGIVRMKCLARSYVWWPNLDHHLEEKVRHCSGCQENRNVPAAAPLHPWEWPDEPWVRLHIDYAGPFMNRMFLVIVDAHSKWIDVLPTTTSTSAVTIEKLRQIFSVHGLPEVIVSDNGTCFTSEEFRQFMQMNGIRHVTSAPWHPASNGLAERAVQTFKTGMKKMSNTPGSLEARLSRFLLAYRTTPQTTTGSTPAELLFKRKVRTRLDLVRPEVRQRVEKAQSRQKLYHDQHAKERSFDVGDHVYGRNYLGGGRKWIHGEIESRTGPLSYTVRQQDGKLVRRHVDSIRPAAGPAISGSTTDAYPVECDVGADPLEPDVHPLMMDALPMMMDAHPMMMDVQHPMEMSAQPAEVIAHPGEMNVDAIAHPGESSTRPAEMSVHPASAPVNRRSTRTRKEPCHLKDFVRS